MDTFWLMCIAFTVGAAAMKLNDWINAKGGCKESLEIVKARRRVFYDMTISSRIMMDAAHQLEVSEELRRVIDMIVADMTDQANLKLMDGSMLELGEAMRQAGIIKGASEFAIAIDKVRTGAYAKEIQIAERKLQAEKV